MLLRLYVYKKYNMKIFGIALCLLALLGACTITKRQHLPGWHVEWKKRHATEDTRMLTERKVFPDNMEAAKPPVALLTIDSVAAVTDHPVDQPEKVSPATLMRTANPENESRSCFQQIAPEKAHFSFIEKAKQWTKRLLSVKPSASNDNTSLMVLLIVTGVLLLLSAVVFLFLEVLIGGVVAYLTYSSIAFLLGVGLLLGGIFLGVNDDSNSTEEIAREKEERIRIQKEKTQEEKDRAMHDQYKRAVRASVIIAVLFFGLGLFSIAIGEAIPLIPIMAIFFAICILLVWGRYRQRIREAEGTEQVKRA